MSNNLLSKNTESTEKEVDNLQNQVVKDFRDNAVNFLGEINFLSKETGVKNIDLEKEDFVVSFLEELYEVFHNQEEKFYEILNTIDNTIPKNSMGVSEFIELWNSGMRFSDDNNVDKFISKMIDILSIKGNYRIQEGNKINILYAGSLNVKLFFEAIDLDKFNETWEDFIKKNKDRIEKYVGEGVESEVVKEIYCILSRKGDRSKKEDKKNDVNIIFNRISRQIEKGKTTRYLINYEEILAAFGKEFMKEAYMPFLEDLESLTENYYKGKKNITSQIHRLILPGTQVIQLFDDKKGGGAQVQKNYYNFLREIVFKIAYTRLQKETRSSSPLTREEKKEINDFLKETVSFYFKYYKSTGTSPKVKLTKEEIIKEDNFGFRILLQGSQTADDQENRYIEEHGIVGEKGEFGELSSAMSILKLNRKFSKKGSKYRIEVGNIGDRGGGKSVRKTDKEETDKKKSSTNRQLPTDTLVEIYCGDKPIMKFGIQDKNLVLSSSDHKYSSSGQVSFKKYNEPWERYIYAHTENGQEQFSTFQDLTVQIARTENAEDRIKQISRELYTTIFEIGRMGFDYNSFQEISDKRDIDISYLDGKSVILNLFYNYSTTGIIPYSALILQAKEKISNEIDEDRAKMSFVYLPYHPSDSTLSDEKNLNILSYSKQKESIKKGKGKNIEIERTISDDVKNILSESYVSNSVTLIRSQSDFLPGIFENAISQG